MLKYKDFEINPEPLAVGQFELKRWGIAVSKETKEEKPVLRAIAFGLSLESAMERIAATLLDEQVNDGSVTEIRDYIIAFRSIKNEILRECKP